MMSNLPEQAPVLLLGLATTSSVLLGATLGLYLPFPKRVLAWIHAFAAGALISAFSIKLAHQASQELHPKGTGDLSVWVFIAGGFILGAALYYWASRFLEMKGAAVRSPARFHKYALALRQYQTKEMIELLPKCDVLRHLPPEKIEEILPYIHRRYLDPGDVLFRAGDPGDSLYIVARGKVEVLADSPSAPQAGGHSITELGEGHTVGEMALLSGGLRTATVRAVSQTALLKFDKADFERMIAADHQLATAVHRLSHERAIHNLHAGGPNPSSWAAIANSNLGYLSLSDENKMLAQAGHGTGWAFILGNLFIFVPACMVIGSNFAELGTVSFIVMLGMFLGGIPQAAVSTEMIRKAGYSPLRIYGIWLTMPIAGAVSALAGQLWLGGSDSLPAIMAEAAAVGAILALVVHEMIPEAVHEGGSSIALPLLASFFFTLLAAAYV